MVGKTKRSGLRGTESLNTDIVDKSRYIYCTRVIDKTKDKKEGKS